MGCNFYCFFEEKIDWPLKAKSSLFSLCWEQWLRRYWHWKLIQSVFLKIRNLHFYTSLIQVSKNANCIAWRCRLSKAVKVYLAVLKDWKNFFRSRYSWFFHLCWNWRWPKASFETELKTFQKLQTVYGGCCSEMQQLCCLNSLSVLGTG